MLGDLVSEAIAGADPVARARSVRLGGSVDEGIEITADAAGLTRVMTNLIMNAIRHTPADGVRRDPRPGCVPDGVELSVSDECGGLSAEDMVRVFDLAWRGEAARTPERVEGRERARRGPGPGHRQGHRRGAPGRGPGRERRRRDPGRLPVPGALPA